MREFYIERNLLLPAQWRLALGKPNISLRGVGEACCRWEGWCFGQFSRERRRLNLRVHPDRDVFGPVELYGQHDALRQFSAVGLTDLSIDQRRAGRHNRIFEPGWCSCRAGIPPNSECGDNPMQHRLAER